MQAIDVLYAHREAGGIISALQNMRGNFETSTLKLGRDLHGMILNYTNPESIDLNYIE